MIVFDGHLDLAMNALMWNRDLTKGVYEIRQSEEGMTGKARGLGTVAFPEMHAGEVALCLCTLLARAHPTARTMLDFRTQEIAYAQAQGQLAYYRALEAKGAIRMVSDKAGLNSHMAEWEGPQKADRPLGMILSMEGADPIIGPDQAEAWWNEGLRVLSLAHYGVSQYSHGTDTEGGVKPLGFALLKEMERLGMVLDLTHLADQAFWDALDAFGGRVVATHNNCRALVPGQRQFTDDQIKAIIARKGVIGAAFDAWMLDPTWVKGKTKSTAVTMEAVVDHIDHICQMAGSVDNVALGTDLDGGFGYEQSPTDLHTIADLQKLVAMFARRGYTDQQIRQIMHGNWVRFFQEVLA